MSIFRERLDIGIHFMSEAKIFLSEQRSEWAYVPKV